MSFSKYELLYIFSFFFLFFCLFFTYLKYFKIHPDFIVTEELHHELGQVPSDFPFLIGNEGTEKKKKRQLQIHSSVSLWCEKV